MRASDIKVRKIYNVIFDPVRDCEFDGKHLAVVLKKNNDKATFIVMPLTSASNGVGINKIHIGKIASLPSSLRDNSTYAVFNQIRTIHASRFIALKEGDTVIEAELEEDKFYKVLMCAIEELTYSVNQDDKIKLLKKIYEQARITKAKDLAYKILNLEKQEGLKEQIEKLENQIKETIWDIPYCLEQKFVNDGIQTIFERSLKNENIKM